MCALNECQHQRDDVDSVLDPPEHFPRVLLDLTSLFKLHT